MKKFKNQKGVTLVALVVTIIVLIILAGISINLLLGDNGLITKAKEAKKQQKIAEIKEKISLELASAETDAIIRNESLEEEQLNDIISKYGTLQDDKDTILTKDDNYEISLKEIWYGTLSTSGSYSDKKKQIEMLEKELKDLQDKYDELEQINSGNSETLNNLRNQITTLENEKKTLEDSLKAEQDKNKTLESQIADLNSKYDNLKKEYDKFFNTPGTATADDIAKGKTAYVNGQLITGTKENTPATSTITWKELGSVKGAYGQTVTGTFSCTNIPNYKNLTISNFTYKLGTANLTWKGYTGGNSYTLDASISNPTMTYDAANGLLRVSCSGSNNHADSTSYSGVYPGFTFYCIY